MAIKRKNAKTCKNSKTRRRLQQKCNQTKINKKKESMKSHKMDKNRKHMKGGWGFVQKKKAILGSSKIGGSLWKQI